MPFKKIHARWAGAALFIAAAGFVFAHTHGDRSAREVDARYAVGESRFIKLGSHPRVHYRDEGPRRAPALILLHGTASSLHTFDELTVRLRARFRVLRFDLPGFGLTGPCEGCTYTPKEDAEFLRRFMRALRIDKAVIGGNSLGGRVAWEFALRYPKAAQALILMDPLGYPWPDKPMGIALARVPVLGKAQRWFTPRFLIRESLREVYGNDRLIGEDLVERHFSLLLRAGNRAAFVRRVNLELDADSSRIAELKPPVLLLWGEADAWIPVRHAALWKKDLPAAKLVIYPGVGHVPQEEAPDAVASDVLKFLER